MLAKAAALSAFAVLVAASAHAQPAPPTPPEGWRDAPFTGVTWDSKDGWSDKDRAKLEAKMKRLDEKLARLDVRLQAEESAREVRLKAIIARAEEHARFAAAEAARAELSPERIRAITERATAQAQAGARAAERAIAAIQPRLDALSRSLDHVDADGAEAAK